MRWNSGKAEPIVDLLRRYLGVFVISVASLGLARWHSLVCPGSMKALPDVLH